MGPPGGTFVGNPGEMTVRLTGGEQVLPVQLMVQVPGLSLGDCEGNHVTLPIARTLDLLGDATTLPLPDGQWCSLALQIEGLYLDTSELGIDPIALDLPLDEIHLLAADAGIQIGGRAFVLELGEGNWVELLLLSLIGGSLNLGPLEASLLELVDEILDTSLLFLDPDRNGLIDGDERTLGPLATSD